MESNSEFYEQQKITQWWVWVSLLSADIVLGWAIWSDWREGQRELPGLLIAGGLMLMLSLMLFFIRLETKVGKDGIQVRFWPFITNWKFISWADCESWEVRKYSPLAEYGGWGYRMGWGRQNVALNLSGNHGLQLKMLDGRKLLVGTLKPDELKMVLSRIQKT